jgi:hypothetical protein
VAIRATARSCAVTASCQALRAADTALAEAAIRAPGSARSSSSPVGAAAGARSADACSGAPSWVSASSTGLS